jgi:hypothetical protein
LRDSKWRGSTVSYSSQGAHSSEAVNAPLGSGKAGFCVVCRKIKNRPLIFAKSAIRAINLLSPDLAPPGLARERLPLKVCEMEKQAEKNFFV